ncbi:MAG: DUF6600 domain-containing protein [Alphaproteobacteria bacterium]
MRRLAASIFALCVIAAVAGFTWPAQAQPQPQPQAQAEPQAPAQDEPPARVGRVSFVSGQLSFHAAAETEWSAGAVNYPVATGGSFATDAQGRAELRIGSQTVDLAEGTEVDVTALNEQVMQLSLPQGRINLHLRDLPQGSSVEIDIPRGTVTLLEPGIYDIDAGTQDQPSRIAVFEGSTHFVGGPVDLTFKTGDAAVISGWDTLSATMERAQPDAFAQWCRSRDYQAARLAAPKYVSPRMTGYEELDQYGSWGAAAAYGQVWYPSSVPTDWAPYREGHWISVAPWGWTWVDAEPWGFAPFHYGRWAQIDGRWGWVPGRLVAQPVYAPALVAFIGAPGVGFTVAGVAGPAVGWFPLAPNEVYWPSYSRNAAYIRNINVTNVSQTKITNITNITVNQRITNPPAVVVNQKFANRAAATVVPVKTFTSAATVAPAKINVAPQTLQKASVSVRPPEVKPTAAPVAPVHPAAPSAKAPAKAPGAMKSAAPTAPAPVKAPGANPPTKAPGATAPTTPAPAKAPGANPPAKAPGATAPTTPAPAKAPGANPPAKAPGATAPTTTAPVKAPGANAPARAPGARLPEAPAVNAPAKAPGARVPEVPPSAAQRPTPAAPPRRIEAPVAAPHPAPHPAAAPPHPAAAPAPHPAAAPKPAHPPAKVEPKKDEPK